MNIEVDFQVYKLLTMRRATEETTYNDVLREMLNLPPEEPSVRDVNASQSEEDWVVKGVRFPVGTEFRTNYKGALYVATVKEAGLLLNGVSYSSPSAAAFSLTKHGINGWDFWECRLSGKSEWQSINTLRGKR
jgi:hypothetical protein